MKQSRGAIIFSFNDPDSLKEMLPVVLRSSLDEIVFAVEDDPEGLRSILAASDPRVHVKYYQKRLGKPDAYNRAIKAITSDIVFLISSDTTFTEDIFDEVSKRIREGYSGALVKVVPLNRKGFMAKVASVMWEMRDIELQYYFSSGNTISGGEFIAIRREYLTGLPEVINDDEYLCFKAQSRGGRMAYVTSAVVMNRVPGNLHDFLIQRKRVLLGHMEIFSYGYSSSIRAINRSHPGDTFRFLLEYIRRKKGVIYLASAAFLELVAVLLAMRDWRMGRISTKWKIAESTKVHAR